MLSRLRSWWQKTSKKRKIVQIFVLVIVIGLIVSFIGGYFFNWTWTGFGPYTPPTSNFQRGKTLYDWLQLAIIPVALAFGVWWLNRLQQQRDQKLADERARIEREVAEQHAKDEQEVATDNQHEAALQDYVDNMSELLLHEKLRQSGEDDEVRKIARVRTLTVLPRLDGKRKASVVQFLYESGLIDKGKSIVDLSGANLGGADLDFAKLRGANLLRANLSLAGLQEADLQEANLQEADLRKAYLFGADLSGANLTIANLSEADLSGAFLREADLTGAKVTPEQWSKAKSLEGTIMPNGRKRA